MLQPEPLQNTSFFGGVGRLWKHSSAWRLVLLAAFTSSAVALFLPPWRWHGAHPAALPSTSGSVMENVGAPLSRPAVQQGMGRTLPVITPQAAGSARLSQTAEKTQMAAISKHGPQESPTRAEHGVAAAPAVPVASAAASPSSAREPREQGAISPSMDIPQQVADADQNCGAGGPMGMPLGPSTAFSGRIVGFLAQPQALQLLDRTQAEVNGKIVPAYRNNLRAVIHLDGKPADARVVVVVPQNMLVHYGEHVEAVGGRASRTLACHYVPNLIVSAGGGAGQFQ